MANRYARPTATGSASGVDWDNAVAFVNHSGVTSSGDTLYMVGGTYTRTGTDAAGAFVPVDGVTYEGDYDPTLTGTDLSTRSRILYPTILDGQSARVCLAITTGQAVVWNGGSFRNGRHIDSGDRIGGGIYMLNGGSFTGRNLDFDACGARWGGGIIGMESASATCTMVLESCQLRRAVRIQYDGVGDIQLHGAAGGDITLRNCTVYTSHAGDALNYALDVTDSADVAVVENTILWADGGATENFGILDESGGSASITVSYSVVAGWAGGGTGNLTSDPDFTSRPGDLSLLSTSPAIDAGNGTLAPTLDYLGNARADDPSTANTGTGTPAYTDIGAFEYQAPAATTLAVSALDASPTVFGPTLALQTPSSLSVGFVDAAPAVLGPTVTLALVESGAVVGGTATTAAGAALVVNVVSAGVVDAAAVVLGPSVATQPLQSVALSSVAAATTVPGPAVATGPALTIALSPVDASTAVLGATVSLTSTGSITIGVVDAAAAVLGPTIAAQSPQTIAAGVVDAAPVVLGPTVAGPSVTIWYAKPTATGTGDGTSWANASTPRALILTNQVVSRGDEIWCQQGLYTQEVSSNSIAATGTLYGGFLGSETSLSERDPEANITKLRGRLIALKVDDLVFDGWEIESVLDGRVATVWGDTSAPYPLLTFSRCKLYTVSTSTNSMLIGEQGNLVVRDSVVYRQEPGVFAQGSVHFKNSTLYQGSSPTPSTDWFLGSTSYPVPLGQSVELKNSIVWATGVSEVDSAGTPVLVENSVFRGAGTGNHSGVNPTAVDSDPLFVDASSADFSVSAGSPAIALADPSTSTAYDILGNPRSPTAPTAGAFEYQAPAVTTGVVAASGSGTMVASAGARVTAANAMSGTGAQSSAAAATAASVVAASGAGTLTAVAGDAAAGAGAAAMAGSSTLTASAGSRGWAVVSLGGTSTVVPASASLASASLVAAGAGSMAAIGADAVSTSGQASAAGASSLAASAGARASAAAPVVGSASAQAVGAAHASATSAASGSASSLIAASSGKGLGAGALAGAATVAVVADNGAQTAGRIVAAGTGSAVVSAGARARTSVPMAGTATMTATAANAGAGASYIWGTGPRFERQDITPPRIELTNIWSIT